MLTDEQRVKILAGTTTTVPLAGAILGIGISRAYRSAEVGEIPTVRLGRKLIVPVPELRKMLGLPPQALAAAEPNPPLAA